MNRSSLPSFHQCYLSYIDKEISETSWNRYKGGSKILIIILFHLRMMFPSFYSHSVKSKIRLFYKFFYKKIENFEQEPYKIILSANLRNQSNEFYWGLKGRRFYLSLKIFTTALNIKEKDIFVAFPPQHKHCYKAPIKIFSEKTEFIIYLRR